MRLLSDASIELTDFVMIVKIIAPHFFFFYDKNRFQEQDWIE